MSSQLPMAHRLPEIDALCLNPACKRQRLCSNEVEGNPVFLAQQQHQRCTNWVNSLAFLRGQKRDGSEMSFQGLSSDYFEDPIGSIYYMEQQVARRWEGELRAYFEEVQRAVQKELVNAYERCRTAITGHLIDNKRILHKIQAFCDKSVLSTPQRDQIFRENLENDLKRIQKTGRLFILERQMLAGKLEEVLKEVRSIEGAVWSREPVADLHQRMYAESKKEELYCFAATASSQAVHEKIQQIEGLFHAKLNFQENSKYTSVHCFICSLPVISSEPSAKNRKRRCRLDILQHMCTVHTEEIFFKMPRASAVKLTLDQLRTEISAKQVRKVVLVDKENVTYLPDDPGVYCLEILSQNSEHLARTRYLKAESKGRDAADILVVIVLYELSRLKVREVELYTKDHYGETLLPILAQMGVKVTIFTKSPSPSPPSLSPLEE